MQVFISDQFGNEGLAYRPIKRRRAAEKKGKNIDMPKPGHAGDREKSQRQSKDAHRRLRVACR
ncbi:hypothetical protein AEAC466_19950 [Asticcacaulis sp. AC466]|nr:hypothetical protein AEAC466_19950 [Asticcacaulis sp. AC466]